MDNIYLNTELKGTKENPEIVKARWQFGMVLVGMALLKSYNSSEARNGGDQESDGDDAGTSEKEVFKITKAIAPVLLPLIDHLGGLSDEDVRT